MTEHYPCRVCTLEVEDDDKFVQCDLCDRWIHIKCAEINHQKYEKLNKDHLRLKFHFLLKQQRFQRFSLFKNHSKIFANLTKIKPKIKKKRCLVLNKYIF